MSEYTITSSACFSRKMLLVVTPKNVYKMESVCGDRRRVNSAVFVLAHPFGSEPEQVHPVLLSNALCESCDTETGQCVDRRDLNSAVPLPESDLISDKSQSEGKMSLRRSSKRIICLRFLEKIILLLRQTVPSVYPCNRLQLSPRYRSRTQGPVFLLAGIPS